MDIVSQIQQNKELRKEPAWELLHSDNGPETIAYLQHLFPEGEVVVANSIFVSKLRRLMSTVNNEEVTPESVNSTINVWRKHQYIERELVGDNIEPTFKLMPGAMAAIAWVTTQQGNRDVFSTAGQVNSVLENMQNITYMADPDNKRRREYVENKIRELNQELSNLKAGKTVPVSETDLRSLVSNFILLLQNLYQNLTKLQDRFVELGTEFKNDAAANPNKPAVVLTNFFDKHDDLRATEEYKAWDGIRTLLNMYQEDIQLFYETLSKQPFWNTLPPYQRSTIRGMTNQLAEYSVSIRGTAARTIDAVGRYTKGRENRPDPIASTLVEFERLTREMGMNGRIGEQDLQFGLAFGVRLHSPLNFKLKNPNTIEFGAPTEAAPALSLDLDAIAEALEGQDIDEDALRLNIAAALKSKTVVSISEILRMFPEQRDFPSAFGLLKLAMIYGHENTEQTDPFEWNTSEGEIMHGRFHHLWLFDKDTLETTDFYDKLERIKEEQ